MPLRPDAPVRLQPYFGYRNAERLRITARALRDRGAGFEVSTRWRAMRTMLGQFASREVAGLAVALETKTPGGTPRRHQGITNREGYVEFDIRLEEHWEAGEHARWETVVLHWEAEGGAHCVPGHVLVPGTSTGLGVISDIDDTIIETGITGDWRAVLRNWRRVVAQMPTERILVPQADVFYSALGGGEVLAGGAAEAGERQAATHRPFFYVSSSPWNLFGYLVAYIRQRGLPLGPVLLRDWGLNRETFGSASHGAHKMDAVATILATYPQLKFALIGDDTQGDLTAFAAVATAHPDRIRAIFIRNAGEAHSAEEEAAIEAIAAVGVPLWMGKDYASGRDFLASIGLAGEQDARAVVAAAPPPPEGTG